MMSSTSSRLANPRPDTVDSSPPPGRTRRSLLVASCAAVVLMLLVLSSPQAAAHAELVQASPRVDSVVGGQFDTIELLFDTIDTASGFRAQLLDPAGVPIGAAPTRVNQLITIPIDPLTVPGLYTVSYTTLGSDGDLVSDAYSFRFEPSSPLPPGLGSPASGLGGIGWINTALLITGAALAGIVVHRVQWARKTARASPAPGSAHHPEGTALSERDATGPAPVADPDR